MIRDVEDDAIGCAFVKGMVRKLTVVEVSAAKVGRENKKSSSSSKKISRSKRVDFKRFRKNRYLRSNNRVDLYSTLPKESARELNLIKKQRALEAAQEEAEELFNFDGRKAKNRIDNYLTGGTQRGKRKR